MVRKMTEAETHNLNLQMARLVKAGEVAVAKVTAGHIAPEEFMSEVDVMMESKCSIPALECVRRMIYDAAGIVEDPPLPTSSPSATIEDVGLGGVEW
jgi:hypothetical protein